MNPRDRAFAAPTFGIEEEFVLLDPATLTATDRAAEAIAALRPRGGGVVGKESPRDSPGASGWRGHEDRNFVLAVCRILR